LIVLSECALEVPKALGQKDVGQSSDGVAGKAFIDWVYSSQSEVACAVLRPHCAEVDKHYKQEHHCHSQERILQL